jgi:hypothetical protein
VTVAERAGQRLQIGRVLALTFQSIRGNVLTLSALSLIPAVPYTVLRYQGAMLPEDETFTTALMIPYVAAIVSSYLLSAAIAKALVPDHAGRRPSLWNCLAAIAKDFFPLVAIATLASFVTTIANVALSVYEFGFILLVPALAVETILAVVIPVRMIERKSIVGTIARSAELTAGHRWQVVLLLLLSLALVIGSEVLIYGAVGDERLAESTSSGLAALVSLIVAQIVIGTLASVATIVVYLELRLIKEGVAPEALASVFD